MVLSPRKPIEFSRRQGGALIRIATYPSPSPAPIIRRCAVALPRHRVVAEGQTGSVGYANPRPKRWVQSNIKSDRTNAINIKQIIQT